MKALLLITLALTLGSTHAELAPTQTAVLSKAIETLKTSSLVQYLSNYAIGAVDQPDNFTRSILTTYPQLNDVRTLKPVHPQASMHVLTNTQYVSNSTLDALMVHVLGFALNASKVAAPDSTPVIRAFADAMALIVKDTNETFNGSAKISSMLPAAALNGIDWQAFVQVRSNTVYHSIVHTRMLQQMVMAMETLERAQSVLGFTNLSMPINMTEFFNEVIHSLQIAVLRQALVLAEEYSIDNIPTFVYNVAGSMTLTAATSGASVALLQNLSANQGMISACSRNTQGSSPPHTATAVITALAAYGLSAYLGALSSAGLINTINTSEVLVALSKLP